MKSKQINSFQEFELKNADQIIGGNGSSDGDIDKDKIKMPDNNQN